MYLDNNLHISFVHDCISLHVNHKQMIYGGVDGTVILSSLLPIWHICTMCITSIVCFLLHFYISINLLKGTWTEQRKEFNCNAYAASKKMQIVYLYKMNYCWNVVAAFPSSTLSIGFIFPVLFYSLFLQFVSFLSISFWVVVGRCRLLQFIAMDC